MHIKLISLPATLSIFFTLIVAAIFFYLTEKVHENTIEYELLLDNENEFTNIHTHFRNVWHCTGPEKRTTITRTTMDRPYEDKKVLLFPFEPQTHSTLAFRESARTMAKISVMKNAL